LYCNDGYNVILCNTNEDIEKEQKLLGIVSTGLIDGAILVPCIRKNPEDEYINNTRIKNLILFNRNIEGSMLDLVTSDHYKGITLAMEHFKKLGYQRIGALVGEVRTSVGKERYWAYMDSLRSMEFFLDEELIKFGSLTYEIGYRSTMELLSLNFPPEAILIFNNALCKGCMAAIKDSGKKIPDNIALVTTDEIVNWDMMEPKLTFIKQPLEGMSRKCYEILQESINNTDTASKNNRQNKVVFSDQLVINESCGSKIRGAR
jgi:LacI family transcriptional regulator